MSQDYVLGWDAGGGSGRCLLLGLEDGQVHVAQRRWSHPVAVLTSGMGRDLDLARVWEGLCEATREVLGRASVAPERVVGIAATSMRHTLVALDDAGEALFAVPNADARAVAPGMQLAAARGAELQARTGRWPSPVLLAARLLGLREERPELWKRARAALALSDWLAFRLCGARATDRTQAAETLLLDLDSGTWAEDLAASLDIPLALLPELRWPGEALAPLGAPAAQQLGLRPGLPVAVGAADTSCGMLGSGALSPGQAGVVAGTTAPVQLVTDGAPRVAQLWTGPHVLPGVHVVESNAGATGYTLEFIARALYPQAERPAARLLAEAAVAPAGAHGIQLTGGGDLMDARRLALPVCNLSFSHMLGADDGDARSAFARAVAEGLAYALRGNLEQLERAAGARARQLRLGGGMSRSRGWARILASVLDRPVRLTRVPESTALGAALCAAVGAGRFGDLAQAAAALARCEVEIAARADEAARYAELYPAWLKLREARAPADGLAREQHIQALLASRGPARRGARPPANLRILATTDLGPAALAALAELGRVEYASYRQTRQILRGDALVAALEGADVLITEIDLIDIDLLLRVPELRVVASCRGNAVNVDVPACSACGVAALNAPGRNADAVADLTLAFLLMLARQLPEATRVLRAGDLSANPAALGRVYGRLRGHELWRRKVGLVGLGAVGREVARRLTGFGAEVLAFDPILDAETVERAGARAVPLDELLASADFISLHAAVTEQSRGLIGRAALARVQPGACLVNTARAALVDEEALAQALREGRLRAAAVDTFSVEPPGPDHPLLRLDNVIATPHIGGNTHEVAVHQGDIAVRALRALLAGERPRELLNPEVLASLDWSRPRPVPDAAEVERLRQGPRPAMSDLELERKRPGA
jgi:autoinducer 2 (AI-2) kinase